MTEASISNREYVFYDGLFSVGPVTLKVFRVLSALLIASALVARWPTFGIIEKVLAVLLMLDVLVTPTMLRLREKQSGKKVESSVFAFHAYKWLMIMAMLMGTAVFRSH